MRSGGLGMGGERRLAGWLVYGLAMGAALSFACARGKASESGSTTAPAGGGDVDGGTGTGGGGGGGVDAGQPDAGTDGGVDAGVTFGGPAPWPAPDGTFTEQHGPLVGALGGG